METINQQILDNNFIFTNKVIIRHILSYSISNVKFEKNIHRLKHILSKLMLLSKHYLNDVLPLLDYPVVYIESIEELKIAHFFITNNIHIRLRFDPRVLNPHNITSAHKDLFIQIAPFVDVFSYTGHVQTLPFLGYTTNIKTIQMNNIPPLDNQPLSNNEIFPYIANLSNTTGLTGKQLFPKLKKFTYHTLSGIADFGVSSVNFIPPPIRDEIETLKLITSHSLTQLVYLNQMKNLSKLVLFICTMDFDELYEAIQDKTSLNTLYIYNQGRDSMDPLSRGLLLNKTLTSFTLIDNNTQYKAQEVADLLNENTSLVSLVLKLCKSQPPAPLGAKFSHNPTELPTKPNQSTTTPINNTTLKHFTFKATFKVLSNWATESNIESLKTNDIEYSLPFNHPHLKTLILETSNNNEIICKDFSQMFNLPKFLPNLKELGLIGGFGSLPTDSQEAFDFWNEFTNHLRNGVLCGLSKLSLQRLLMTYESLVNILVVVPFSSIRSLELIGGLGNGIMQNTSDKNLILKALSANEKLSSLVLRQFNFSPDIQSDILFTVLSRLQLTRFELMDGSVTLPDSLLDRLKQLIKSQKFLDTLHIPQFKNGLINPILYNQGINTKVQKILFV
ncbi:hypothetical protein CYY_010068 [Polysphondylium violaceum]|uniref:Uncharacterized protein n=1 Tax=Polysphondylium violaceum TaxID=133409 RepID=A0A8J4PJF2_9MYCE|nr:hypothetical protein CYY_010068 [Polysphondylium violaceum]